MVCVDICRASIVNDVSLPVLAKVSEGRVAKKPLVETYIPLKQESAQSLRVYIRDHMGRVPSFELGMVECTLHFIQQNHDFPYQRGR